MAQIYTISSPGTSLITGKCLLGIYNSVGSGRVIRLYKIWTLNNQTQAPTTVSILQLDLYRFTTGSGGIAVNPVKHDSTNENIPAQIVTSTGMNYTLDVKLKSRTWSTAAPGAAGVTHIHELETVPSLNMLHDASASYNTSWTQNKPIVLREGYGAGLISFVPGLAGINGAVDCLMEFSMETI